MTERPAAAPAGPGTRAVSRVSDGTLVHALAFVAGFSLVFIVGWGGAATAVGVVFGAYKSMLGRIGGVVVILFGLMTAGVLRVPWLLADTRRLQRPASHGLLNSGLFGILFAAGWSPCIGATLGAILTLGLAQPTSGQAMVLATTYTIMTPDAVAIPVAITRDISFQGKSLGRTKSMESRKLNGTWLQEVDFTLPANARPGLYTLKTKVSTGYALSEKETHFQVQ